jgi:hypothetical protein
MSPEERTIRKKNLLELSEIFLSTHERLMRFVAYNIQEDDEPNNLTLPPEADDVIHKYLSECDLLDAAKMLSASAMKNE